MTWRDYGEKIQFFQAQDPISSPQVLSKEKRATDSDYSNCKY